MYNVNLDINIEIVIKYFRLIKLAYYCNNMPAAMPVRN